VFERYLFQGAEREAGIYPSLANTGRAIASTAEEEEFMGSWREISLSYQRGRRLLILPPCIGGAWGDLTILLAGGGGESYKTYRAGRKD